MQVLDYGACKDIVEDASSVKARHTHGSFVSHIAFNTDDDSTEALSIMLPLKLANGKTISVEVDTGSDALILNDTLMGELGIFAMP